MDGLDKALMGTQSTSLMDAILKSKLSPSAIPKLDPEPLPPSLPPLPNKPWYQCVKRGQRILYAPKDLDAWYLGKIWEIYPNADKISILFDGESRPKFVPVDQTYV